MPRNYSMKKNQTTLIAWIGAGVVLALILLAFVVQPLLRQSMNTAGWQKDVSVQKAAELREDGAFVLDVRTPEEWDQVHIPGAALIPLDQLAGRVNEVPKDQPVLVYCRSGNRSQTGRDILLAAGYEQVTSMTGGITAWAAAGYPTETGQ